MASCDVAMETKLYCFKKNGIKVIVGRQDLSPSLNLLIVGSCLPQLAVSHSSYGKIGEMSPQILKVNPWMALISHAGKPRWGGGTVCTCRITQIFLSPSLSLTHTHTHQQAWRIITRLRLLALAVFFCLILFCSFFS